MGQKFQKQYTIKQMLEFVFERWKLILIFMLLAGFVSGIAGLPGRNTVVEEEQKYILIDQKYKYSSLVMITPKESNVREINIVTFLGIYTSEEVINDTIDELGLSESYIDIFNKLAYTYAGDAFTLGIESPVIEVDGHSWEEVLNILLAKGQKRVEKYFPEYQVEVVDKPYIVNEENTLDNIPVQTGGILTIALKKAVLFMMLAGIGACVLIGCFYLLNGRIYYVEDLEDNLEVPVLGEMAGKKRRGRKMDDSESVKRIAYEIINRGGNGSFSILNIEAEKETYVICNCLMDEFKHRQKKCVLIEGEATKDKVEEEKGNYDIVLEEAGAADKSGEALMNAGYCDSMILVVKRGKAVGKDVIRLKNELDRNKINCFGIILAG